MNQIEKIIRENLGSKERVVRTLIGVILIGLGLFYFGGVTGEKIGIALAIAGVLPLITGLVNFCPVYSIWGRKKA
jgi:hypothetical protein